MRLALCSEKENNSAEASVSAGLFPSMGWAPDERGRDNEDGGKRYPCEPLGSHVLVHSHSLPGELDGSSVLLVTGAGARHGGDKIWSVGR
jgi:hypothetical protein